MKLSAKRILSTVAALAMAASFAVVPAFAADNEFYYEKEQTLYMTDTSGSYASVYVQRASAKKKVSAPKSSNADVAIVNSLENESYTRQYEYKYYDDKGNEISSTGNVNDYSDYSAYISLRVKKPGTTNVSFKYDGKSYTSKVTVKKYVNPVKSMTISGVNSGKSIASKTKSKATSANLKQTKKVKSAKIVAKAKDGWKIQRMEYVKQKKVKYSDYTSYNTTETYYWYSYSAPATSKTLNLGTVAAKTPATVRVTYVNTKDGATITTSYPINH